MSSKKTVIEARGLGKKYTLDHRGGGYRTLRESLLEGVQAWGQRLLGRPAPGSEEFWAVNDVSFQLQEGDCLGIIGRNGAGKSTLLKLLSRITEPTKGSLTLRGRVASLLEVGTGFHPELTGRENIFLNGAILGLSRQEITAKFDEIVAFAEVERFLDLPVKRYSSGMYMRLAFAVAAHLEPEILIVDEVLAVGDAKFQKKCLGRMSEVARGGRSILFVSHNLGAVRQFCNLGLVMDGGRAIGPLPVEEAIALYQSQQRSAEGGSVQKGGVTLFDATVNGSLLAGGDAECFGGEALTVRMAYQAPPGVDLCVSLGLRALGADTMLEFSHNHLEDVRLPSAGQGVVEARFPALLRSPGRYAWDVQVWLDGKLVMPERRLGEFSIGAVPAFRSGGLHGSFPSLLMSSVEWKFS
jgi:lipopolysaccharide transport system ATP-binding protein